MYVYPLRAEKNILHTNLTCVHGDGECTNPIPGDIAETRGFALSVQGQKGLKGLPRATHCTDRAQNSGIVTSTVELCPPHPTFRTKVGARKNVSEEKKMTIIRIRVPHYIPESTCTCLCLYLFVRIYLLLDNTSGVFGVIDFIIVFSSHYFQPSDNVALMPFR